MNENKHAILFIVLAFVWSWIFFTTAALASNGVVELPPGTAPLIVAGAFGPSLAAFYLTYRHGGIRRMWELLKNGFRVKMPLGVLLFVAAVPLLIAGVSQFGAGDRTYSLEPTLPIVFVVVFFFGGSFGEEFGWRGFFLPRLLEGWTAIVASLIVAAIWSVWHLPLFWIRETSQFTTPFWLYVVYIAALSIQYVWMYSRTGGNLFACMLLHTFTNLTVIVFPLAANADQLPRFATETALNAAVALALVVANRKTFFAERNEYAQQDHD